MCSPSIIKGKERAVEKTSSLMIDLSSGNLSALSVIWRCGRAGEHTFALGFIRLPLIEGHCVVLGVRLFLLDGSVSVVHGGLERVHVLRRLFRHDECCASEFGRDS